MGNPETVVYDYLINNTETKLNEEDFEYMIGNDNQYFTTTTEGYYGINAELDTAIDELKANMFSGGGQVGNTDYSNTEVVDEEEWVPDLVEGKDVNGEKIYVVDHDKYEGMSMMEIDKQKYDKWLKQNPKDGSKPKLTTVQDVNKANKIELPPEEDIILTKKEYDRNQKAQDYLDSKDAYEKNNRFNNKGRDLSDNTSGRDGGEKFIKDDYINQPLQDTFDVSYFTPQEDAKRGFKGDLGAESFKSSFESKLPEGFKIFTRESVGDGRNTLADLATENIPEEVTNTRKTKSQFLFVQAPDGSIHEIKSLGSGGEDISATKERDSFINFIQANSAIDGIEDPLLENIDKELEEEEADVKFLFTDAILPSSYGSIPTGVDGVSGVNVADGASGGALGLSIKDLVDVENYGNTISFTPYEIQVQKDGADDFSGYEMKLHQPFKTELDEALKQIQYQDKKNGITRDEALTINSPEVQATATTNLKISKAAKIKNEKWEDYIEGNKDFDTGIDKKVVKFHTNKLKSVSGFKAQKANYLSNVADRDVEDYMRKGTSNIKELQAFQADETIIYNIAPGEKAYKTKDGRLIPAMLVDRANEERVILGSKFDLSKKTQTSFFDAVENMDKYDEQWDVIKRNYNDGAKFVNQLGMATADLAINVGYGAYMLSKVVNPFEWPAAIMMNSLDIDDPVDSWMNNWSAYKEEVSEGYKKDQAFGEISSLADVGEYALQSIAQQLPIIVSMIATGGLTAAAGRSAGLTTKMISTLSNVSSSSMVGLSSFGSKVSGMNYEEFSSGRNLYSDTEILVKGLMYGIVEGGLAAVSTAPMLNKGVTGIKGFKATSKILDKAEEEGRRTFIRKMMTGEILPETLSEMGAEGLTTGLQNLIDGRPFLENMAETLVTSGIWGAGMSGSTALTTIGQKNFANNKQTKAIREGNKDIVKYQLQIQELVYANKGGKRKIQPKIDQLLKLKELAQNRVTEATNQVEVNIKKKGIRNETYVKDFVDSQVRLSDIRQLALDINNNDGSFLTPEDQARQLKQLDTEYRGIRRFQEMFTDTDTFADGYAAMGAKAMGSLPFSKSRLDFNKITNKAISNLRDSGVKKPTQLQIDTEGSNIVRNQEIDTNIALDKKISKKLGLKFNDYKTKKEAVDGVTKDFNEKINSVDSSAEKSNLEAEKLEIIEKINKGTLNGVNIPSINSSVVVVDNMHANNQSFTGIHEVTHSITNEFLNDPKYKGSFDAMSNQIVHYLKFTGQESVLRKMQLDNANLMDSDGNFDSSELISSFAESVRQGTIDLEKMDNQIAVLGKMFNSGLMKASDNSFNISFSGETEILEYFISLGKALKTGVGVKSAIKNFSNEFKSKNLNDAKIKKELNKIAETEGFSTAEKTEFLASYGFKIDKSGKVIKLADALEVDRLQNAASETKMSETSKKLYVNTNKIFDSELPMKDKGFQIGLLWKNEIRSRLNRGYKFGNQFLKPTTWSGWSNAVMEDVLSKVTTGGSGIPGLVKNYKPGIGNVDSLQAYINLLLNKRITGYLPNNLVTNDLSIDSETARQIEDVGASNFDEDIDITSARRGVVPESEGRVLMKFDELSIVTPEVFDKIKEITTKTLKKVALTDGFKQSDVNQSIEKAIQTEMTKVIREEMGPITKSILGFSPKKYSDFIENEMSTIVGAMPIDVIKQKAKSKDWSSIFKLKEIGREDIKKVDENGKVTNYRKQIFSVEKPKLKDFKNYFTRGKYTTLIAKQKSLVQNVGKELTRTTLFNLKADSDFISDLADRTGMTTEQVSTLFIENVIDNLQDTLDQTAGEQRSRDVIKFSEKLASKSAQSRQTFIDGLRNPNFRKRLSINLGNEDYIKRGGNTSALEATIKEYFSEDDFKDMTTGDIKEIARDFGSPNNNIFQKQIKAERKLNTDMQLANMISEAIEVDVENQADYKEIELALGINNVDFDDKSLSSVNQGRAMALKIAKKIGREKFIRLFAPGLAGPGGLAGIVVKQPNGNQISDIDYIGELPTTGIGGRATQKKNSKGVLVGPITYTAGKDALNQMIDVLEFRNIEFEIKKGKLIIPETTGSSENIKLSTINKYINKGLKKGTGLFLNVQDLFDNVIDVKDENGNNIVKASEGSYGNVTNKGKYDSRVSKKNWYFSNKWEKLGNDRKAQLEFVKEIAESGNDNKRLFRETIESLKGELTPTEARWLVHNASGDMTGAIKASASLIGYPNLNKAELAKSLNLSDKDVYVLEHMTPAKYMALLTYKYLLDPSVKNGNDFNAELDNFHTIILPKGVDNILFAEGLGSDMGMKHKIGDMPFETRYKEILKIMQLVKINGDVIGNFSTNFSETNNNPETKKFNAELVNSSEVIETVEGQNSGISVIESEILDKALSIARDPNAPIKKIRVFDFDDTLARSDSKVFAVKGDQRIEMSAERFAKEGASMLENGFTFDFSDFNVVKDGKPGPMLEVAKKIQDARGTEDLFVLTARAPESQPAIKQFLDGLGLDVPLENITGLGKSSEFAKSSWVVNKAAEGYNDFYFTDDAIQNVEAVKRALNVIDVKSKVQQAKIKFSETVDQQMNNIIYEKTGIDSFKEFSDVRAQAEGRNKRTFDLIPASAEDFGGLLYNLLGKGEKGNAQWSWMEDNLIKPYNRGINDMTVAQNTLAADFKALKNNLKSVPKNLKQKAFGGFTFEDVVRVNAWSKQGIDVEGLSKRDLKEMKDFVKANPEIDVFSTQLIAISKIDGYHYPGSDWLAGTITTDMREGLRTTSRSRHLAQWNENIDLAFSKKNLNKLEAAFGPKYREALEDSIRRMKTGTNRGSAMGRIESRFLDYINNSIGGVMFLNSRSAILQTISSLNFIELTGDNNLLNAGKAFANQPQFWSDFMTLMNSDYLVDRRNGLKINVSESEIAESAKTSTNKAKAVIATLLKKGFVLTQIADSFAISTGGASYYRNKVNSYLKQGLSKSDAEARAFEDFKAKSEESQQSSDPSKISQQQASTAGKVILAFANTPSQYSRIMKKAGLDLVNGRGDWKNNVSKILYYGALQNIIFTTLQSALFAIAFSDDEEEEQSFLDKYKGAKTINSMTDNVLRGLGVGGAVVSTLKNIVIDIYDRSNRTRPEYADVALKLLDISPPIDIKVSKFRQGMTTWDYGRKNPEARDPFNINNPAYEAGAKVIASTTNVPVDRLYQKVENIQGALDDDNANWKRIAMILGWPEWQLDSEKEKVEKRKEEKKKRKEANTRRYAYKPVMDEEGMKKLKIKEDTEKYFKLRKPEQVRKLDSLGLTSSEIKSLKYEKDRVNKLLELMK